MHKARTKPRLRASLFFLIALVFSSCDLLRDGIFEVSAWSPGEGFHDPDMIKVSLVFSLEPDKVSAERSFSLAEEGRAVTGSFAWKDSALTFVPSAPLEKNKDYFISLDTGAQDKKGLSLERRFEAVFTTRPDKSRPVLLASIPSEGGTLAGEREEVRLKFSQPMDRSSFSSLYFNPSLPGVWSLEDSGYSAVFTPSESWTNGKSYKLILDAAIMNANGLNQGKTQALHFYTGLDLESPVLLSAYIRDRNGRTGQLVPDNGSVFENKEWERNSFLELVFSKPVDSASVINALGTEPSFGISLESAPGYFEAPVFRFNQEPVWGTSFILHLNNTVKDRSGNVLAEKQRFYIRADGGGSKPPSLKAIRMPMNPAADGKGAVVYLTEELSADLPVESGVFPFETETPFWMELYFDTAVSAAVNAFSLMDRFKFSATNNALSFSPREIRLSGFSIDKKAADFENLFRVEVRGPLINHPNSGVVTVEVMAGLLDNFGNKSGEASRFILLK